MRGILIVLFALSPVSGAMSAGTLDQLSITGVIRDFECGDNCYLTLATSDGKEVVGLCAAPQCGPWNEQAAIPERLIGAKVTVELGEGRQLDGEGNDMESFPAKEGDHLSFHEQDGGIILGLLNHATEGGSCRVLEWMEIGTTLRVSALCGVEEEPPEHPAEFLITLSPSGNALAAYSQWAVTSEAANGAIFQKCAGDN